VTRWVLDADRRSDVPSDPHGPAEAGCRVKSIRAERCSRLLQTFLEVKMGWVTGFEPDERDFFKLVMERDFWC